MIADVLAGRAKWCVIHGDWQDHASELPDLCVDHIITDPPYSTHVHGKSRAGARKTPLRDGNGKVTRCAIDREVDFGFECITQAERIDVGALSDRVCKRWTLVYSDVESGHLWIDAMPLEYVRTCAMLKIGGTPQFTGDRPGTGFEAISVFHRKGKKKWNGGGKLGVYRALTVIERGGQSQDNNSREHTTQKDLAHTIELLSDFTDPGDLVLDLYTGSGIIGVACIRLGRRFIGFERKATYAAIAHDRILAEEHCSTLHAHRAGQIPMFGGKP